MKGQMQYVVDHADEIDKLMKVKAQVSQVKEIMMENIDKVYNYICQIPFLSDVHLSDCIYGVHFIIHF